METPEKLGFSQQRLDRLYDRIQGHVDQGELPGAVMLVARRGKIAVLRAFGFSDIETHVPLQTHAIFRIASAAKIMVSVGLLTLFEEARLALTNLLSQYLPEFENVRVFDADGTVGPAKKSITVVDLLRHTSGLGYGFTDPLQSALEEAGILRTQGGLDWTHPWTLAEWAQRLAQVPLEEEPGTCFNYGLSHDVLGLLIERISGQPLDEFMRERVFEPLGMPDTGFMVAADQLERLTSFYQYEDGRLTPIESAVESPFQRPPLASSGGGGWDNRGNGGVVTTATDFARLLQMLLNEGELDGVRFLGRKTVELMRANHLAGIGDGESFWPGVGFAFGYAVLFDLGRYGDLGSVGEMWWAGSTNVNYWWDPREELVGIFMTHTLPFGHLGVMSTVKQLTYQALTI